MRTLISRLTLLLAVAADPAAAQWTVTGTPVPELAAFDSAMQTFMTARNIPSGQLAVTWQGRLVLARGYSYNPGPNDLLVQPDSLFRLASVSKPVTSTLVHRLAQDGQLDLDQTLASLVDLAPLPGQVADPRLATVTVRDLLEHLGGFNGWPQANADPMFADAAHALAHSVPLPVGQAQITRTVSGVAMAAEPGSTYRYSNYGYMLLGRIVEAASGMSYQRYCDQVFNRIGVWDFRMARSAMTGRYGNEVFYNSGTTSTTVIDPSGAVVPVEYGGFNIENLGGAGNRVGNAIELVRWLANLDAPAAPDALLDAVSLARMFGLPQNHPLPYTPGSPYYGSGWSVRDFGAGGRTTWHAGSLRSITTSVVRHNSGFNFAALVNRRAPDNSSAWNGELDTAVFGAFAQVTQWPPHDLFPTQLPVVFRSGFD